jgi:hypothetical protein
MSLVVVAAWRLGRRLLAANYVKMVSRRRMLPGVHSFDERLLPCQPEP